MPDVAKSAVYVRDGKYLVPTVLSRGPWSAEAQHGGAPAALLAGLAEEAVADPGLALSRLTLELIRPVPIAPLQVSVSQGKGQSVRRVELTLSHEGSPVAKAVALCVRQQTLEDVGAGPVTPPPMPAPDVCSEPFRVAGMAQVTSFYETAMEIRMATGRIDQPGPASAWFRFARPLMEGLPLSGFMRAAAASDFGNGLSWILPVDAFTFMNTDLTVYLHRTPVTEWVGVDSVMTVEPHGIGLVRSSLYDEQGAIGVALQNLFVRAR